MSPITRRSVNKQFKKIVATLSCVGAVLTASASTLQAKVKEPDQITVQHILIGFKGSVPGKNITRTQEEARKLAIEVQKKAQKGDFLELVKKHTDDSAPGIYKMSNIGVEPTQGDVFPRDRMVPAFGDVGFKLKKGAVGMADFNPKTSPYGYHIIKRLE